MIHADRRFQLARADSPEDLAQRLTSMTWTLCTGFAIEHEGERYLFLNDSFSEDGAQEYAVISHGRQVESVTFGWCTYDQAIEIIRGILAGLGEDLGATTPRLDHGDTPCPLCA